MMSWNGVWCLDGEWNLDPQLFSTDAEEHHASLSEIIAWIKESPPPPTYRGCKSSRSLKRSLNAGNNCLFTRLLAHVPEPQICETMVMRARPRVMHQRKLLATRTIRRILKMQESLFKYGTYVPRNDREAEASPEAVRWKSGRRLEWIRLKAANTFESNWTWEAIQKKFPNYLKSEIGNMFYIYDYKYSGEHRVRRVFNGARQSPNTYTDTYAPTVRAESTRFFHV
jgi:hypothetical protein